MTITFYDLVAKDPIDTWSPNPFKTKYSLGFKKLPYKTVRLEYPELHVEFKKLGIPPTTDPSNGSVLYTSPSITDDSTGARVSDSYKIAEYLDKAYPDTPRLFPPGSEALQAAFYHQFNEGIFPIWPILLPRVPAILRPPGAEYFIRTRTEYFGLPLADLEPSGQARAEAFNKTKAIFDSFDSFYSKSSGPFLMGETPVFLDFVVVSLFHSLRILLGEDGDEWKLLSKEWHNGRWGNLLAKLEVYSTHPGK